MYASLLFGIVRVTQFNSLIYFPCFSLANRGHPADHDPPIDSHGSFFRSFLPVSSFFFFSLKLVFLTSFIHRETRRYNVRAWENSTTIGCYFLKQRIRSEGGNFGKVGFHDSRRNDQVHYGNNVIWLMVRLSDGRSPCVPGVAAIN